MGVGVQVIMVFPHGFDEPVANKIFGLAEKKGRGTPGARKLALEILTAGVGALCFSTKEETKGYPEAKSLVLSSGGGQMSFKCEDFPSGHFSIGLAEINKKMVLQLTAGKFDENFAAALEFARELFVCSSPALAVGLTDVNDEPIVNFLEWASGNFVPSSHSKLSDHWFQMFGPPLADRLDFSGIKSAYAVEKLGPGVFIQIAPHGGDWPSDKVYTAREELEKALRGIRPNRGQ